jgi:hypothetical protein
MVHPGTGNAPARQETTSFCSTAFRRQIHDVPKEQFMSAAAPQVILRSDKKVLQPISVVAPRKAWRLVGWLGMMLAVVGFADVALQWYPLAFQSPEWEFGTVSVSFASLPLLSIGSMALLASFLARGSKHGVIAMAFFLSLLTIGVVLGFLIFLTDVPLALRAATGPSLLVLKKSIARTVIMGVSFGTGYLIAAVTSFRYLMRRTND